MICVDASLAVKWVLEEEDSDRAWALYRVALRTREIIVAPPLLPIEVTNIVRQRMRRPDGPTQTEALDLLDNFLTFQVDIDNPVGLHRQALILADTHGLPAAYDGHYLALAQHLSCDFWTADQRLLNRLGTALPFVKSLADYIPTEASGGTSV